MAIEGDVSRKTITVLVLLTVIISVLGTLSVMSAVAELKSDQPKQTTTNSGWVGLGIEEAETGEKGSSSVTGKVIFGILPQESQSEESQA